MLLYLPNELIDYILKYLKFIDICRLKSTCKEIYHLLDYEYTKIIKTIPWKITTHIIYTNLNDYYIDRCWIIIGEDAKYFIDDNNYCEACEHAELFTYGHFDIYNHGEKLVKTMDLYTIMYKGIGGDVIDDIIKHYYIENNNSYIPIQIIKLSEYFFPGKFIINISNDSKLHNDKAILKLSEINIQNIENKEYKEIDNEKIETCELHGLFNKYTHLDAPYDYDRYRIYDIV